MSLELKGAGVVITGGGGGIGGALARKFAARGARVIVADLDEQGAARVAGEIGGSWIAVDAASESGVEQLITTARAELGTIDLFCANAGVAPHGGPEAPEDQWAKAWNVNVMAHVRAAKLLLPDWLERGRGHFLATVSAAGLLTMLGSAPYSVTKHGALAFAEWLRATYQHRGITVQAVCPQGVRTNMLAGTGTGGEMLMAASAIEPEQVADAVLDSLSDGRFLVLPHPEVADYYAARATEPDRWLGGMNKLQRKIEEATGA
ncbi:SDR family oxidoreductase [Amycolatopsis acidicola]|uniref:SDR family oxidoreductase n=1 Tax=Amycolatopsis acidicola TaxID=2596893 RepID=A0A5N0USI5_9PSEU|nr:SDR family oxidoreductase [Amycolatopsis acidicola]KAA9154833.1 SDR family oxidoreductase [Amycolatopsis acidicola]